MEGYIALLPDDNCPEREWNGTTVTFLKHGRGKAKDKNTQGGDVTYCGKLGAKVFRLWAPRGTAIAHAISTRWLDVGVVHEIAASKSKRPRRQSQALGSSLQARPVRQQELAIGIWDFDRVRKFEKVF